MLSLFLRTSPAERSIDLPPQTSLPLHMAEGTQLFCVAGTLQVQTPTLWIAGSLLTPSQPLDEGGHYALERTGWTTLRAGREGARLLVLAPVSPLSRLFAGLRSAAHALLVLRPRGDRSRRSPQPQ